MKILFISSNPTFGGATTANLKIAETIASLGNEITFNDEFLEGEPATSVNIKKIGVHWRSHPSHKQIREEVYSGNYDIIIWGLTVLIPFYLFDIILFRKRGIRQIALFHSISFTDSFSLLILEWFFSKMAFLIDALVFVSEFTKTSWGKYKGIRNHKRSAVIYNPIDRPSQNTILSNHPTMGYVGRLSEEKQPELFMKLSSITDYNFVVFGNNENVELYRRQYPRIHFMGVERDIEKIYSNIDILILTSRVENCPMVILEAKSRGIPVIAPNVGGISEIVKDREDGLLYRDFSVSGLNEMMVEILKNYAFFSSACIENSKRFFKNEIAKKWSQLFEQI